MPQTCKDLSSILDEMRSRSREKQENYDETLTAFCKHLLELKKSMPFVEWRNSVIQSSLTHPLQAFLLQDPFTNRAFYKPRGYAGDAIMMDLLYAGDGSVAAPLEGKETRAGLNLYQSVLKLSTAQSVRNRKDIIAKKLDEIAGKTEKPEVLAVACGHLREAQHSVAFRQGRVGRYIALDSDPLSIKHVHLTLGKKGVTTCEGNVLDLIREGVSFASFDFVYSAGLYDYLDDKVAKRLTEKLFRMVKPGGVLLVANFQPDHLCAAYIEACCDWWLVYRNEPAMKELLKGIPPEEIDQIRIYPDETGSIYFLEVKRNRLKDE
ncbi:class I SAM-dependent methyltransferase [Brevibacillus migulae]|uniref:class I SAM-dependent methyltransferase n=1 Tax=Brevibacillus migulae TaxID=1644114 RepID=UPI00106EA1BA|nr:class I SAM-dependent methyltransferase [Brevibacillus migulae]